MIFKRQKTTHHQIAVGLDFGSSQIKLAVLERTADGLKLQECLMAPTPEGIGKAGTEASAGEVLQQQLAKLKITKRNLFLAVNCASAAICEADLPRMPFDLEEVHGILRLNSQRYLRRDLTDYYLDTCEIGEPTEAKNAKNGQMKLLVAAAAREEVKWYRNVILAAKARPEAIELSALTVINALQILEPEVCEKEIVLLLDLGARSSSLNILRQGQPVLTRLVNFGAAQVRDYVSQLLSLPLETAELEMREMTAKVQPFVESQLLPLGREVRASMDFFERQQDCHITKALACGGMANLPPILTSLSESVGIKIEPWNPLQSGRLSALDESSAQWTPVGPSFAAALGAAAARLGED